MGPTGMTHTGTDGERGRASHSVLVVDDDPAFADLARTLLERVDGGVAVTTAVGAETGLERVRAGHFDCVISDYHMPEMDGLAFLDRVARLVPDATRVLFTSDDSESLVRTARRSGAAYVEKRAERAQYERLAAVVRRSDADVAGGPVGGDGPQSAVPSTDD